MPTVWGERLPGSSYVRGGDMSGAAEDTIEAIRLQEEALEEKEGRVKELKELLAKDLRHLFDQHFLFPEEAAANLLEGVDRLIKARMAP